MGLLEKIGKRIFSKESVNAGYNTRKRSTPFVFNRENEYKNKLRVLQDTQVSTGYDILKYILSSKSWDLIKSKTDDGEVHEFMMDMFQNMDTELNDVVKRLTNAILWGFHIEEIIFDIDGNGRFIIKDFVPLHPHTLQVEPFIYDEDYNLIEIHQVNNDTEVYIPIDKVLKYSYNNTVETDYGKGLLEDFEPIVIDKLNINQWLMNYLQKHEAPTLYAKVGNAYDRDIILQAFDEVADGTTGIVVGNDEDIGVLESSHRGEAFFTTLQQKDNEIFRRYYLGNLLLGDNSQTGTYAQSYTQLEFGKLVFDGILEEIANTIQKQIINPLIEMNYGDKTLAPILTFDKFTTGDYTTLLSTIKPLIDNGTINADNTVVQDTIAQYFKRETGLIYDDELPEYDNEPLPPNNEDLTNTILSDLNAINTETGTDNTEQS